MEGNERRRGEEVRGEAREKNVKYQQAWRHTGGVDGAEYSSRAEEGLQCKESDG